MSEAPESTEEETPPPSEVPPSEEPEASAFASSGGEVLDRYEDGRPKRWKCGKAGPGKPLDPPGVDPKNVIHRITAEGSWEGANPTKDDIDEIKKWRTDWMDV